MYGMPMPALLDHDQLRTFVAIAQTGSFTRAADVVHKTQSAVSMQMKKLEERIGRPIFGRDGRAARLTEDGERLLDYARRIVRLNEEAVDLFRDRELAGHVRLGVPDDYADRYLPDIMETFSRAYPRAELSVVCEPTVDLIERIDREELDIAIVTNSLTCMGGSREAETFRKEQLLWVASARHAPHREQPIPLALGKVTCSWRRVAIEQLEARGVPYRILFTSWNAGAVGAAVLAGLAISVFPESGLRPGMRVLTAADGFEPLPAVDIGLLRNRHPTSKLADALADHVIAALDNLSGTARAAQ
jgi:DNA-binding transcriptional LysR family regulator